MRKRTVLWVVGVFVALLLVVIARPAFSASHFDPSQSVRALEGYGRLLVYNYTSGAMDEQPIDIGSGTLNFTLSYDQWLGFFVYDYSIGTWTEALWMYAASL